METTEYKCLQSQFSVLYNDSMQLKTQLDDARQQLQSSKNIHLRHIEMMEVHFIVHKRRYLCIDFRIGRLDFYCFQCNIVFTE